MKNYWLDKKENNQYSFEIGDIVRILPTAGKAYDIKYGRDFSKCKIIGRHYPINLYGMKYDGTRNSKSYMGGGFPMAGYKVVSLFDESTEHIWEIDLQLIRKNII